MSAGVSAAAGIDRHRLALLRAAEDADFAQRTQHSARLHERALRHLPNGVPMTWMRSIFRNAPIFVDGGSGATFTDVDGNPYLDFNVSDLSMTMGFGNAAITAALAGRARRGTQFLLPGEDAIVVAELLAARVGLPYWQFTLSATGANTEVIRVARFITGRHKIVIFGGHYHGHLDETLVREDQGRSVPDTTGLPPGSAEHTIVVPFNDLTALERVLASGAVALVLTEPALTNCNVVLPEPGFHAGLRELTQRYGTLLCLDEAHTFQFAYGGLVREWQLPSDFVVLGKGFGSGVAFGLYGMSAPVAEVFTRHTDVEIGPRGIATGGTTYASALAAAVARVPRRSAFGLLPRTRTPPQRQRGGKLHRLRAHRRAAGLHGEPRHLGFDRIRRTAGVVRTHTRGHRSLRHCRRRVPGATAVTGLVFTREA